MDPFDTPHGFILSDAALYSFNDQDVYPDILSFCVAIPDHLKPLFLIPIQLEPATGVTGIASRIACKCADEYTPTGDTPEGDLFSVQTFVYDDNEPTIPQSDPGSIFDIDGPDAITHHQDLPENIDENTQSPTDTSYMSDVDMTEYWDYPYRTKEKPVRHSSALPVIIRLALRPEELESRTPEKIRENAETCSVKLISFDKRNRVYTFSVGCGNVPRTVKASLSDLRHAAVLCDCPFWQWNGPEFHAKENDYLLGDTFGTASPPDIRDPDRKYWLCKHAYAVTTRLEMFVQDILEENKHIASEEELLDEVDSSWEELEGVAQVPLKQAEEATPAIEIEWMGMEEELPEGAVLPEEELEEEELEEFEPEIPEGWEEPVELEMPEEFEEPEIEPEEPEFEEPEEELEEEEEEK